MPVTEISDESAGLGVTGLIPRSLVTYCPGRRKNSGGIVGNCRYFMFCSMAKLALISLLRVCTDAAERKPSSGVFLQ